MPDRQWYTIVVVRVKEWSDYWANRKGKQEMEDRIFPMFHSCSTEHNCIIPLNIRIHGTTKFVIFIIGHNTIAAAASAAVGHASSLYIECHRLWHGCDHDMEFWWRWLWTTFLAKWREFCNEGNAVIVAVAANPIVRIINWCDNGWWQ